jgi:hypothetical protein
MEDTNTIAKTKEEAPKSVKNSSVDMHQRFGPDKCGKIVLKTGKLVDSQNLIPDINMRNRTA